MLLCLHKGGSKEAASLTFTSSCWAQIWMGSTCWGVWVWMPYVLRKTWRLENKRKKRYCIYYKQWWRGRRKGERLLAGNRLSFVKYHQYVICTEIHRPSLGAGGGFFTEHQMWALVAGSEVSTNLGDDPHNLFAVISQNYMLANTGTGHRL